MNTQPYNGGKVMNRKLMIGVIALFISVVLAACGGNEETTPDNNADEDNSTENKDDDSEDEEGASSGEVPEDLAEAKDPTYSVGSKAEINADHMKGMEGAVATIEGAYDTTAYEVTYTPTNGGKTVKNHKWVIHEEMKDAKKQPYEKGDEVVLESDHMKDMKGAKATIDDSEDTTVYMVTYKDTETGEEVENHKWVVEDELSPAE